MLRNRRQNGSGSPRSTTSSPTGSPRIIVTRSIGGSPRSEVGEIDTRSPFQSVRAAKESQLNLALKELDSLKQQIRSIETSKGHALRELENAKTTLQELTRQLETLCKSKQAAIEAAEAAKARVRQLQDEKSNSGLEEHRYLLVANKEESPLRTAKEEAEKKIRDENLEEKLEETNKAIESLQEQLNNVRTSDLDSFAKASLELDRTKKAFQEIVAEERSFRSLVDSLQAELDSFKGHNSQLKKKADEAEALAEKLRFDLDNSKKELEAKTPKGDIQQFTSEAVQFLQEAEEMKKKAELLRQEAVIARAEAKEAEERLKVSAAETLAIL